MLLSTAGVEVAVQLKICLASISYYSEVWLGKLSVAITEEKKSREESEQAIFEMLRDVIARVKTEIELEKKKLCIFRLSYYYIKTRKHLDFLLFFLLLLF